MEKKTFDGLEIVSVCEKDQNGEKVEKVLTYAEIYEALKRHLQETVEAELEILDYFILCWSIEEEKSPSKYSYYTVNTEYGGSEGIYTDVYECVDGKRTSIFTLKTLDSSADAMVKMYRIACEIYLYLESNGCSITLTCDK